MFVCRAFYYLVAFYRPRLTFQVDQFSSPRTGYLSNVNSAIDFSNSV